MNHISQSKGWRNLLLLLFFLTVSLVSFSQVTCDITLRNDTLIDSKHLQFDIYVKSTGASTFAYGQGQYKFSFASGIKNGGTVTVGFISGYSELTNSAQIPSSVLQPGTGNSVRISVTSAPGSQAACSQISNTGLGTRICRVELVNTVDFANLSHDLTLLATAPGATTVWYMNASNAVALTTQTLVNTNLVNPTLNLAVNTTYTLTGGSYCAGGTGINVTLSGSQTGVRYQLKKNGVNDGPYLNGTGSGLTWSNRTAGAYTVFAWRTAEYVSGTMGPATVSETTPDPVSVSVTPNANPVVAGTSVTFTATPAFGGTPTYQWSVNSVNVGTNQNTYSYVPANNDVVACLMTSSLTCVTGNPATGSVTMTVTPLGPVAPTVVTNAATNITGISATLNGNVTAGNDFTVVDFEYGLTAAYGTTVQSTQGNVTGNTATPVDANISGLTNGQTYHFRCKGTNSVATVYGADMTFIAGNCPLPDNAGAITGPASVCQTGTGYIYSVPAITNATSYVWTLPAGFTIASGSGTNSITVTVSGSAVSGNVSVYGSSICGQGGASNLAVAANALPTPTITGAASTCVNSTANVYTTQAGMTGYTWSVSAGGAITLGNGTNSITVTWSTTGPKTVSVNYTNAANCTATLPATHNVTVNALPNPTITGPSAACIGSIGNTYTTEAGMTGYSWSVSAGGTISTGLGTNTISVAWNAAGPQTVTVNYTNAGNCSALQPTSYPVSVSTLPTPTITGLSTACVGSTTNVYSTQSGMSGYTWTVSAGGAITAGSGTNSITVTWSSVGPKMVTVNYNNANNCSAATPAQLPVTVVSLPTPSITGSANACIGSTNNVYTTQTGMTGYTWTVSAGGAITAGAGTSSITVTWSTTGPKTVSVNYTNANNCSATTPATFAVNVSALPVPTITGPANACTGTTNYVYSTETGMTGYTWTVSAGGVITAGGGTSSITVTWNTTGNQSVTVNYTNASGCSAAVPVSYSVAVSAMSVPVITGPTAICVNSGYYDYTTQAGMTNYTWTVSAGGAITFGAGTNAIQVTWSTPGAKTVTVNYTNPGGCSATNPTVLGVNVSPLPGAAGTITGTSTVCGGTNGVAYSISSVNNSTSYVWNLPAGASIATGYGTNNITVNFAGNASSGTITAYGNNVCGNGASSPAYNLTVNPIPGAAGAISGPIAVCEGTSGVVFSVASVTGATSYAWTVPAGVTIVSGANTNSITVNFTAAAVSGPISVAASNSCGSGAPSNPFTVAVNPIPDAPTITANGYVLTSSAPTGNKWYFNGTPISGQTGQTMTATQTGSYWAMVTLNDCSSDTSNHIYIVIDGVNNLDAASFELYPVPNDGKFTVRIANQNATTYTITVYNNIGATIFEKRNVEVNGKLEEVFDLRPLPNGVYSVVFRNNTNQVVKKFIVGK